jgi:hypothetical protein
MSSLQPKAENFIINQRTTDQQVRGLAEEFSTLYEISALFVEFL